VSSTDVKNSLDESKPALTATIPSLDGFRAVSIFIVAASHCGLGWIVPGGLGVTIFFFLSGYLITMLLLREADETLSINIRHFYLRRVLRLYPPLIVTLAIAYGLVYFGLLHDVVTWAGALSQLFYFANYYQLYSGSNGIPTGTGVLWSLAVEEHFYLVYPLLLLAFIRYRRMAQFPAVLVLLCIAALVWRFHLVAAPNFEPSRTFYASDTRFDSILYGAILALVSKQQSVTTSAGVTPLKMRIFACVGLFGLVLSLLDRSIVFRETIRYSLQGICLMPIFFYAINVNDSHASHLLNWSPVRRIGVYSYSIYLIHFVLLSLIPPQFTIRTNTLVLLTIVLGGSCLYAFLIDKYIDPYFRQLRKALH